jgi:hypothetical protein
MSGNSLGIPGIDNAASAKVFKYLFSEQRIKLKIIIANILNFTFYSKLLPNPSWEGRKCS